MTDSPGSSRAGILSPPPYPPGTFSGAVEPFCLLIGGAPLVTGTAPGTNRPGSLTASLPNDCSYAAKAPTSLLMATSCVVNAEVRLSTPNLAAIRFSSRSWNFSVLIPAILAPSLTIIIPNLRPLAIRLPNRPTNIITGPARAVNATPHFAKPLTESGNEEKNVENILIPSPTFSRMGISVSVRA